MQSFFFPYNHNLVRVYMECDYSHLNHNSLVSQKKYVITKGLIIRGVYCIFCWQAVQTHCLKMTISELFSSKSGDFVAYFVSTKILCMSCNRFYFFWGHQVLKFAPQPPKKNPVLIIWTRCQSCYLLMLFPVDVKVVWEIS